MFTIVCGYVLEAQQRRLAGGRHFMTYVPHLTIRYSNAVASGAAGRKREDDFPS
jgi:hypothetical protein